MAQFHRAKRLPAYARILDEAGVRPAEIRTWGDFQRLPLLGKHNTFQRFSLEALCQPGTLDRLAGVLTSSGQSGNFAFGLSTRHQARRSPFLIDLALHATFGVDERKTLLINALPMGVGFSSNAVTVAETSVREDMVLALADRFGPYFEQLILVTDPLFLKLLCDASREQGFDWQRFRVNAVIGEETFGEHFRSYVGRVLGTDPDRGDGPLLGASMGVGELGLNLFFETAQTIALRRRLYTDPALRRALFEREITAEEVPMLFAYSPGQTLVESIADDAAPPGFGQLVVTVLDAGAALPLPRYQTGDLVRLYEPAELVGRLQGGAPDLPQELLRWRLPLAALRGRDKEEAGPVNVSALKDCLYRDPAVADCLTGAFRLEQAVAPCLHVQLRPGGEASDDLESRLRSVLPRAIVDVTLRLWPHAAFPYGMTLDYERKFKYL